MVRNLLRRWLPHNSRFHNHRHLRLLGNLLQDPNLWHLNRRSVSGAAFVGLFLAWVPVPVQMILAAVIATWVRVNLPVAVVFLTKRSGDCEFFLTDSTPFMQAAFEL